MRSRPTIWILLCLLLGACVWLLFHQGGRRTEAGKSGTPASPAAATASNGTKPSMAANVPANGFSSTALVKSNSFPFRLSNTPKSIGELVNDPRAILLANALIDTRLPLNLSIPKNLQSRGDPGAYIVQANGPIDGAFREMLASDGAQIVSYIPNNAYLVEVPAAGANVIAAAGFSVIPFEPYYKLPPSLLSVVAEGQPQVISELTVAAYPGTADETEAALDKAGLKIAGQEWSPFGQIFTVRNVRDVAALAQMPLVQRVEPFHRRVPANDLSRWVLGVSGSSIAQTNYMNLYGSNVIVEVNDSGVDTNHPDFLTGGAAPLRVFFNNPADGYDTDGHGTHVAGIIAGDGFKSPTVTNAEGSFNPGTNGQYRGKAPLAKIFAMNKDDADQDLQLAAVQTNALISNNSWAIDDSYGYDLYAAIYDAGTRDSAPYETGSQPVLFVFAAGNNGGGDDTSDPGGGNPGTVQSPATAKDVISVAAIQEWRNVTNEVTNADGTVGTPWAAETSTDYRIAGFSARGNVGIGTEGTYERFKPDVAAPGTFVVSTRSTEWDQQAYYYQNPTNDDSGEFDDITIPPYSSWVNAFPLVPTNALQVDISVVPSADSPDLFSTNLTLWIGLETAPGLDYATNAAATNIYYSIPPNPPGLTAIFNSESFVGFNYAISNSTAQTVTFDLYTDIITTNGEGNEELVLSNLNNGLGPWYRYESGTSMAAADISGVLALMQDYFINHTAQTNPSPALLKALLINGARATGVYNYQVENAINYEGWGLANLPDSIPAGITNQFNQPCASFFMDQSPTNALATGDSRTFFVSFTTNAALSSLRFTLAWTDPPGNPAAAIKLVNNLDLIVTNYDDPTNPVVYFGNDIPGSSIYNEGWAADTLTNSLTNGLPVDSINNVENIFLPIGAGTNFSVTVVGRGVNVNAVSAQTNDFNGNFAPNIVQDYALVVSGNGGVITVANNPVISNPTAGQDITVVTNSNLPLENQFAGANAQLLGTNTISLGGPNTGFGTNAILTIGQTNQWHFYVVTNNTSFTNAAFVTFLPPTLSIPRMGVFANSDANSTQPEADIDLYVAGPGDVNAANLLNLDPNVISNCVNGNDGDLASLGRGGTEYVTFNNSASGNVYYIGVKAEDQEAAEYDFLPVFSATPFSQNGTNGQVIYGIPVPINIPDGSPQNPGYAYVLAIALYPMEVQNVIVTNIIQHENFGDLIGSLNFNGINVVLNNHDSIYSNSEYYGFVYDDSQNPIAGSQRTDGPGNLQNFTAQQAVGAWLLTEEDNSLTQTGSVQSFSMLIQPHINHAKGLGLDTGIFTLGSNSVFDTYVDVPVKSYHVPDEAATPRIPSPHRTIAANRAAGQDPEVLLCSLANFEVLLSKDQLKKLYKNPQGYAKKVAQRYDELVKQGWALPVYQEMVVSEASRATF